MISGILRFHTYFHRLLLSLAICFSSFSLFAQEVSPASITINGMEVSLPANSQRWLDSFRSSSTAPGLAAVQLHKLPDLSLQKELASSGVRLLHYLSSNTYLALIDPSGKGAVRTVRSIVTLSAAMKIGAVVGPF